MNFSFYGTLDFESWLYDLSILILLAYCRPIHLIFIEFQSIDSNLGTPPKTFFFFFNCYNHAIIQSLLTKAFLAHYWNSKLHGLIIESWKKPVDCDFDPACQSTYLKANVH
jgi:hypothetical protein